MKVEGKQKPPLLEIFPSCDILNWYTLPDLKVGGFLYEESKSRKTSISASEVPQTKPGRVASL